MKMSEQSILGMILPQGVLAWFDVIEGRIEKDTVSIILEEKNIPPLTEPNKRILSKGFTDITITDFPIRGRRTLLTFRRRYWQVENQKELLKRDIQLSFPGTQLEKEFAIFLKEDGGRQSGLSSFYRQVSLPPNQGV